MKTRSWTLAGNDRTGQQVGWFLRQLKGESRTAAEVVNGRHRENFSGTRSLLRGHAEPGSSVLN